MTHQSTVKVLSFLFLMSLAGNIALASWWLGTKTTQKQPSAQERIFALDRMINSIEDENKQEEAKQVLRARVTRFKEEAESMKQQRQVIRTLLDQETFSRKDLEAAFREMRSRTTKAQEAAQNIVLDAAPYLSQEQRKTLMKGEPFLK